MKKHFKNQVKSIERQFNERRKLLRPFIKKYGKPVIVHSVQDVRIFKKILKDGKLKLPSKHNSPKKTPHMEKFLGIDNCIYYSLGFVYFSAYKWRYNLIFELDYLKNAIYYKNSLSFKIYRKIVDYWYENDRNYLEKLANVNSKTRDVINRYYYEEYEGKVRRILEFWKIEKELYNAIFEYPDKKRLIKIIKKTAKQCFIGYPLSKRHVKRILNLNKAPEIIGKKENDLLKNPDFLGFFIPGRIDKNTLKILREKYSGKIIFDGKKIRVI